MNNELLNENPCFNCPNREVGCHGKCIRYKSWKRKVNEFNKKLHEKQNAERIANDDYHEPRSRGRKRYRI